MFAFFYFLLYNNYMNRVKDLKTLRQLRYNNKPNDTVLVEETNTLYQWDGSNWNIIGKPGINASLYQINQSAYAAMPAYTEEQVREAKKVISDFTKINNYYMLLNNETRYYTLFDTSGDGDSSLIEDEVIECLQTLGEIKEIELTENNTVECWVSSEAETNVYYLFNYNEGVIKCQ